MKLRGGLFLCVVLCAGAPPPPVLLFGGAGGLSAGCTDLGWAPRQVAAGAPASVDFSAGAGWLIGCTGMRGPFSGLRFRLRAAEPPEKLFEVQLDADGSAGLPRVALEQGALESEPGGWLRVSLPMALLDPAGVRFQRILFRPKRAIASGPVLLDEIELLPGAPPTAAPAAKGNVPASPPQLVPPGRPHSRVERPKPQEAQAPQAPPRARAAEPTGPSRLVSFSIRCDRPGHAINPLIYGVANDKGPEAWAMGATARRWGGNTTSRYNWELGNAWNTGNDWFFMNTGDAPGPSWKRFLEANAEHGVTSAVTLPMLGWVAKDTTSWSFPVSLLGPQRGVAPENHDAGNGVALDGKPLPTLPPERTSVPAPPEFIARWVRAIRATPPAGERRILILDNEPGLWSSTHRDVHPEPVSYDELLKRTLAYATAIRAADPDALIAGPAEWGWSNFFFSAKDLQTPMRLDRLAHGNVPLLPWLLRRIREAEERSGTRLLDLVDVHFYPQGNVGVGRGGGTDPETAARRIRSTRGLWDPAYKDESWIDEPVMLIPRLRRWIAENHPGLGLSIGEWNFGAETHMSGGLATAEALGRFGAEGLDAAFFFSVPPPGSPALWAFRAYRNFDGAGARFLDQAVPVEGGEPLASLFASRSGGHLVAVLLNHDPARALDAHIALTGCGTVLSARAFAYGGGPDGLAEALQPETETAGPLRATSARYSIETLDLQLGPQR